ncbi:cytochrome P450 [Mycena polygramma]|nr:cytochrome P450 [Mycena polygramma]
MISLWLPLLVAPVLLAVSFTRRCKAAPFPPGPKRKPLIGNLLDVPFTNPWATFETWRQKYGDIVYLEVLGNSIVVLNSMTAVTDLLEKRASNYSHRPTFTMSGELMGFDRAIGLNNRDDMWRQERKLAMMMLGPAAVKQYIPVQEHLAAVLLSELLDNPDQFAGLINLATARLIFETTYGLPIDNMENKYIKEAEVTFELMRQSIQHGAYILDFLPWLKHIPAWVPFSPRRYGSKARAIIENTVDSPYYSVKAQMDEGTAQPSLVSRLLSDKPDVEGLDFEYVLKWTASTMYGAGAESSTATICTFFLAMAISPDVQAKAQQELDLLLNNSRLPTMEDRSSLPYVNAVIKETLRWHVAVPLAIPRRVDNDDIYNGYLIPKGTIILPNVHGIAREGDYVASFSPDKYLGDGEPDPSSYAFGFGRRACPGRYLAEDVLFIIVASVLTAFTIAPATDSAGQKICIDPKFLPGLISHPEQFKCSISPRTPGTKTLIANQLLAMSPN